MRGRLEERTGQNWTEQKGNWFRKKNSCNERMKWNKKKKERKQVEKKQWIKERMGGR